MVGHFPPSFATWSLLGGPFSVFPQSVSSSVVCEWGTVDSHFLAGDTSVEQFVLQDAQHLCEEQGVGCSGVTRVQSADGNFKYALRPGHLYPSTTSEQTSYVKQCRSGEEEVVACQGESFVLLQRGPVVETMCVWESVPGFTYLPGHVFDEPFATRSLLNAQSRCVAMGNECAGITLQYCDDRSTGLYTLRALPDPKSSPQAEQSWLKNCKPHAHQLSQTASDTSEQELSTLKPSVLLCDEAPYSEFRTAAIEFYTVGIIGVHLLMYVGELLREAAAGGWKTVLARCAPAALQAMLLRAEERLFPDFDEHQAHMTLYFDYIHESLGVIETESWNRWPLAKAWARLSQLRLQAEHGRTLGAGSIDFVLCFCGVTRAPGPDELPQHAQRYAEVADSLAWLQQLLTESSVTFSLHSVRVFVMEKCGNAQSKSDLDQMHEMIRRSLSPVASKVEIEYVDDELRADDATAYLAHISRRYTELADWTFFLHADAPEHIHPFRLMEELVAAIQSGALQSTDLPFVYLSHNYLDLGKSKHTWDTYASPRLWRRLFGGSLAPPRDAVGGYCCVQFVVPRRLIELRPREWYTTALEWFASAQSYWDLLPAGKVVTWQDLTCRTPAQLWMPWWHVVFGEDLMCPERHLDPRLPLFVQMRSIPPDRFY